MSDEKDRSGDATQEKPGKKLTGSVTVEVGNDAGNRIVLSTVRKTVRGRFALSALGKRKDVYGKKIGMKNVGDLASQLPDTPGIHFKFEFASNTVTEFDPLSSDKELHEQADRAFAKASGKSSHKTRAWPTTVNKYQDSFFKTFVREFRRLVELGDARVVSGEMPTQAQLDALPGRYMHDPMNSSVTKPKYEDQYEGWIRQLESTSA